VVFNGAVHVVLAVDGDLLLPGRVVHREFVVSGALYGLRLEPAHHAAGGQAVGGHLLTVVDPPGDDGLVRVSLEERDDHFRPDARARHAAPALAGPGLRHPQPARAVLIPLALAIPEELHLHPAVLVDVDLLAAGADHRGRLHAVDHRTRRVARGAEVDGGL